jgi:hypothetical protein
MTAHAASFIPYNIYNQTWYTIVAETRATSPVFVTEKTARPLLSKRLFVMFGSRGCLSALRSQGFETFGDVIDESYDNIEDNDTRWNQAWKQVDYLLTQDPKLIYQKISSVIDHNYNLISTTNHYKKMICEIHNYLSQ